MNKNTNFTEEELQLAEQYMSGNMNIDEKAAFEKMLAADAAWNEKFIAIRLLITGVQEASLREEMQQWNEKKMEVPVRSVSWMKSLAIAASIIIAISVVGWMWFFKKSANEQLYADFYKPDPGLATKMSVSDNYEFERAMVDYKTGQYKAALERWNKQLTANTGSDTLQYFIAAANLGDNNPELAIQYFDKVIEQTNSAFKIEAYWYKGLALLQQGKEQEAIAVIEQSAHPQKDALLKKLKD